MDAVVEIFSWVGLGVGALLAGVALILYVADGTWVPVRVMIDEDAEHPGARVARWFASDGGVGIAHLTHEQEHALAGLDAADVFVRNGSHHQMRLTQHSRVVRAVSGFAIGFVGLGVLALIVSLVLLLVGA